MKITNEILNRFLDGELSEREVAELNSALSASEELRKKLDGLKLVHNQLYKIEEETVSDLFTEQLMKKLPKKLEAPFQQRVFVASVSFFIVAICVIIIGYIASLASASVPQTGSFDFMKSLGQFTDELVSQTEKLFGAKSLSILGSIFSFIIIISGYFFFEMQKRSKANLGNGQHL